MTDYADDIETVLNPFRHYPLVTIGEVKESLPLFSEFLRENREVLVQTGYPRTAFPAPLPGLFGELGNLYFIKLPVSPSGDDFPCVIDVDGGDIAQFRTGVRPDDPDAVTNAEAFLRQSERIRAEVEFDYMYPDEWGLSRKGEMPLVFVRGLSASDVIEIESLREKAFRLKYSVLEWLEQALDKNLDHELWTSGMLLKLVDELLHDDAEILLKVDRLYTGFDLKQRRMVDDDRFLFPGGVSALIGFVGYCEKELKLATARRLQDLMDEVKNDRMKSELPEPYTVSKFLDWCLRTGKGPVDEVRSIVEKERHFYGEFTHQVNVDLENELREVHLGVPVKRKHVNKFVPWATAFLEFAGKHVETTGGMPNASFSCESSWEKRSEEKESGEGAANPVQDEFVRNDHGSWDVVFAGKNYLGLKHNKGFFYIRELLRSPDKVITAQELSDAMNFPVAEDARYETDNELTLVSTLTPPEDIDMKAVKEYRAHLKRLREGIYDAREHGDVEKAERLQEECEFILKELEAARNPRDKVARNKAGAVNKAINRAVVYLQKEAPEFGAHLNDFLRVGQKNCYRPPRDQKWRV